MNKVFYCIFLTVVLKSEIIRRLSSTETTKLNVNDSLISTLGYFKSTLQQQNCSLVVQMFNETTNKYQKKGNLNSTNFVGNCNYLQLSDNKIQTNQNLTFIDVPNAVTNYSSVFTIDDEGVFRFIATYAKPNIVDLVSTQVSRTDFKITPQLRRSFSQLKVQFIDTYEAVTNKNKWKFIAQFGQMTIYFSENPQFKTDYVYSSINIKNTQIFDFADETFPGTLYNNITFHPRCFGPRIYINFKPPYTFVADEYWPIFHLYEQGGYKITQIAYSDLPQFDFQQNIPSYYFHRYYSPCPPRTFQYRGNCLASCPSPYYHQMRGQAGKCVLQCEEHTPVDEQKRICRCFTDYEQVKMNSQNIKKCPTDAIVSPYGCYCKDSKFYDGKYTFSCVSDCPKQTYGKNNLCMQCPAHCQDCQQDNYKRNYLECKKCKSGYKIHNGQCVSQCVSNHALSITSEDVCATCTDKNCVDCSENKDVCLQCDILTSLADGNCSVNCTQGSKIAYNQLFDSVCLAEGTVLCTRRISSHYENTPFLKCDSCSIENMFMHKDGCVNNCPSGYREHQKYCVCDVEGQLTIGNECVKAVACPITMFFDKTSHSCLACPFGCMSCINRQCTSCNPGYYLYISPQIILCRRKSPLFPCDKQYQLIRKTCVVKQFNNANLRMRLCLPTVPNCRVCIPRSQQNCVMCNDGYLLYNNSCIEECPQGLIKHEDSCILTQIQNCQVHHLYSNRRSIVVKQATMTESSSYKNYIYFGFQPANDPVGFIPYFQQLTTLKNDGIPRQTDFYQPSWICHKAIQGYGVSDDKKSCLPCPAPCVTCYYAQNYSCLTQQTFSQKECGYLDPNTGQCLGNCTDSDKFPQLSDGKLYCKPLLNSTTQDYMRVDSSIFPFKQKNGSFVFFIFGEKLSNYSTEDLVIDQQTVEKKKAVASSRYFVSAGQEEDLNKQQFQLDHIKITNETSKYYYLNLTRKIDSVKGENNLLFPNTIYGTDGSNATHVQWMKTWLAYIGYCMSIVILILHAVYIGNQLLYKVDNTLIFVQTIFYFSFAKNFAGRLLSQFYYGWSFSHAIFLPNLFDNEGYIPDGYIEDSAPVSYKLVNIDANFIRNAGFSFTWMLIFLAFFGIVCFVLWAFSNLANKRQAWNQTIAKQAVMGLFQFFSFNIIYFSISQLYYSRDAQIQDQTYYEQSQALAIICLCVYFIYTIFRFAFNVIGGLYMAKRFLLSVILFAAYQKPIFILPAVALQVVFFLIRIFVEQPDTVKQKIIMGLQTFLIVGAYLLMFLCLDAGVNTIIISIIVFLFIVMLGYDLTTLYLESKNEYLEEEVDTDIESIVKATRVKSERESYMRNHLPSQAQG